MVQRRNSKDSHHLKTKAPKALMGTPPQKVQRLIHLIELGNDRFYSGNANLPREHDCRIVMNLITIFNVCLLVTVLHQSALLPRLAAITASSKVFLISSSGARSEIFCCPLKPFPKILTTLFFSCSSNSLNSMGESPARPACL